MANNYCESSSKLMLTPEQLIKARPIIDRICEEIEEEDCVGVEIDFEKDGLWFHHKESINTDNLALIVQALLDELEINEPFVFSWSYTCSSPRIDEFGGGAYKIRRGMDAVWVDAHNYVTNHP